MTSPKPTARRDSSLDALKWISIIGVISFHLYFPNRYSAATIQGIELVNHVFGWCVLSFFSISGYLARTKQPVTSYIKLRAPRLLVPYFLVSLASYAVLVAINRFGIYRTPDILDPLHFASLLYSLQGFGPQLYFLPYLFLIGLVWTLLSRWFSPSVILVGNVVALGLQCLYLPPAQAHGAGIDRILLYAVAFSLGAFLRHHHLADVAKVRLVAVGFALGLILLAITRLEILIHLFSPPIIYLAMRRLPANFTSVFSNPFLNPGAVYLWHCPILLPTFSVVLYKAGIYEGLNALLACVFAVLGSLAIHFILGKCKLQPYFSL